MKETIDITKSFYKKDYVLKETPTTPQTEEVVEETTEEVVEKTEEVVKPKTKTSKKDNSK